MLWLVIWAQQARHCIGLKSLKFETFVLQCEKAAFEKYGDEDGIEEHRRGLLDLRQDRRAQKRAASQKLVSKQSVVIQTFNSNWDA